MGSIPGPVEVEAASWQGAERPGFTAEQRPPAAAEKKSPQWPGPPPPEGGPSAAAPDSRLFFTAFE